MIMMIMMMMMVTCLSVDSYRDFPGNPIKCTFDGQLKDLFQGYKPKQQRKMYYQQVGRCSSSRMIAVCLPL